jgi:hypothetical protein
MIRQSIFSKFNTDIDTQIIIYTHEHYSHLYLKCTHAYSNPMIVLDILCFFKKKEYNLLFLGIDGGDECPHLLIYHKSRQSR